jgi:hypothetical protein
VLSLRQGTHHASTYAALAWAEDASLDDVSPFHHLQYVGLECWQRPILVLVCIRSISMSYRALKLPPINTAIIILLGYTFERNGDGDQWQVRSVYAAGPGSSVRWGSGVWTSINTSLPPSACFNTHRIAPFSTCTVMRRLHESFELCFYHCRLDPGIL